MEKVYVIYCPREGGYWSSSNDEFKGELYATEYKDLERCLQDLKEAVKYADGYLVEIKEMYRQ